ncbi:MAG: hypothetical protein L0Y50_00240 [Beijerinckiaceae bacterium]|nr:hypothetical protein [Beijerinckiaceae bacterium]
MACLVSLGVGHLCAAMGVSSAGGTKFKLMHPGPSRLWSKRLDARRRNRQDVTAHA